MTSPSPSYTQLACRTLDASEFLAWPKTGRYAFRPWREIFLSRYRVLESGCWEWTAKKYSNGYGCFSMGNRGLLAHRVSFAIHNGICPATLVVRHTCDYRPCINPEHLLSGTHKQNMADAWARNRFNRKSLGKGRRKIQDCDIPKIFSMRESGMFQRDIAAQFSVRPNQISRILTGERRANEAPR
jgi:hypothetical protein